MESTKGVMIITSMIFPPKVLGRDLVRYLIIFTKLHRGRESTELSRKMI